MPRRQDLDDDLPVRDSQNLEDDRDEETEHGRDCGMVRDALLVDFDDGEVQK